MGLRSLVNQESPPLRMKDRNVSADSLQTSSQSRIASMFVRSQPTCSPSSVTAVCDRLLHSEGFRHPKDGLMRRELITFLTLPCCHSSQRDLAKAYRQKKGTMPMKCASSAVESYSISRWHSASALFPKTVRRCHLLV